MDTRAEALLGDFLRAARPGDGFYGEEGAPVASATGITWVVDPVDGTVNYLYGVPMYAVSVAAVVGEPDRSGAVSYTHLTLPDERSSADLGGRRIIKKKRHIAN